MEFQIEGIKENWLMLQKEERGVEYLGIFFTKFIIMLNLYHEFS